MTFKRTCKAMLKEENYMDALSYFCEKLNTAMEKGKDIEMVWTDIDEKLWDLAAKVDDTIEDATTNVLRISSALRIAVDDIVY